MEAFTITCSTCASRIRVRNPNMIGQLANCPKCGAMIMIAAPTRPQGKNPVADPGRPQIEVEQADGSPVDSMAVTKEGLPPQLAEQPPVEHASFDATDLTDDDYRLADLDTADAVTAPPIRSVGRLAARSWEAESSPHIPSSQWTSDSTTKKRQYLLIGFLGFAGIVLAALVFVGFLRWHATDSNKTALQPAGGIQPQPLAPVDEAVIEAEQETAAVGTAESEAPQAVENRDASQPSPEKSLDTGPATASQPTSLTPESDPADPVAEAGVAAADNNPNEAGGQNQLELPKQLQAFAQMLQVEIQPQFPDAMEILSEAPLTAEELGLATTESAGEVPAIDLAPHLQTVVPALVMGALPLPQFVSLWSNISGIPTGVDLDSLAAAGIDRNQQLSLAMVQSATLESLVSQLGAPLGLSAEPRENRFLQLVVPNSAMESNLPETIDVTGLVGDAAAEQWLSDSLKQLLPDREVEWKISAGQLSRPQLADATPLEPLAWFKVVRLIEGWRLAAGLPSASDGNKQPRLSAALVKSSEVTGLDSVLKEVTPQSRPVAQVLPRICEQAGVHAWIDWPNVASVGLAPQSTALIITAARPLRRILADYAEEFSLVIAVVDPQTLWLTSNRAYRAQPQLFVIPSEGQSAEEWKSRLRPLTPASADGKDVGSVVAVSTPDSQFVLVRCCRAVVSF